MWSRIWTVLSDFFVEVGCHPNLQVAMYGIDSMRQLAMKFLERDELANFSFQNDFLRPFVVVMRQSKAVEIRELIIRCAACPTDTNNTCTFLILQGGACKAPPRLESAVLAAYD